jgi:hypothetical protein
MYGRGTAPQRFLAQAHAHAEPPEISPKGASSDTSAENRDGARGVDGTK